MLAADVLAASGCFYADGIYSSNSEIDETDPRRWHHLKTLDPDYHSAARPPDCEESCRHCSAQFLPKNANISTYIPNAQPIELHDDAQANAEMQSLIFGIESNCTRMKAVIEMWGNLIVNRWLTWTNKTRESILLTANPKLLPKGHLFAQLVYEETKSWKHAASNLSSRPSVTQWNTMIRLRRPT